MVFTMVLLFVLTVFNAAFYYNHMSSTHLVPRLKFKIEKAPILGLAIGYVEKCLVILLPFVVIEIYKRP